MSRRSLAIAAVLVGTVSLVIGAHAALNKRALDAAKAVTAEQVDRRRQAGRPGSRSSSATAIIPTPTRPSPSRSTTPAR